MFSTRENDCEFWVYIISRKTSILFSCCYTIGMTSVAPPWQLVLKTGGKSDLERIWVQFLPKNPFLLLAFFSLNQASFSWRILLYLINLMNILPWHQIFRIMPIQKNKNMSSLREHSQHELSSLIRKTVFSLWQIIPVFDSILRHKTENVCDSNLIIRNVCILDL